MTAVRAVAKTPQRTAGADVNRALINPIVASRGFTPKLLKYLIFQPASIAASRHISLDSSPFVDGLAGWMPRRTTVKTKTISATLQAANAPVGVHKVAGVAGLYLKIGETGTGSYFYRYRLGDRRREIGLGSRDKVVSPTPARRPRRGRSCGTKAMIPRPEDRRRARGLSSA
jgi:Arm DNA-binding domain